MPGTGKTATVREVVNALQAEARRGELHLFSVEINGMQLSTPSGLTVKCMLLLQRTMRVFHATAAAPLRPSVYA